ncbi:MAG TPA: hypothetical protein VFN97_01735 [Actinospica sp.]|nr:hypothetical protein [Actinospica sp.]
MGRAREQRRRWLTRGKVGRLWHIRPQDHLLARVADQAGVRYRTVASYNYPVGGQGPPTCYYDAEAARRLAPEIRAGLVEVDPAWRTDTPEGRRLLYRGRAKAALIVLAALSPFIAILLSILI